MFSGCALIDVALSASMARRRPRPDHRWHEPASGTYCLFMTDSAARQLSYRLLVGSEQLLAATNNQESDAHIRWQNTNPGRSLVNGPVQVFTAVALISLPTVMFGGFSLLRLLVARRLNEFQVAYFRAGHAHAGVLLVLSLAVLDMLTHTSLSRTGQWIVGALLVAGVLAQSGGMFVHMGIGKPGQWSAGNTLSSVGAVLLAGALLTTGAAVIAS